MKNLDNQPISFHFVSSLVVTQLLDDLESQKVLKNLQMIRHIEQIVPIKQAIGDRYSLSYTANTLYKA